MSNQTRNKIKKLRERDGDMCWLCRGFIDFTLPYIDKMRGSLDHVIPRKWGGMNDVKNLKLAHQHCNSIRPHRYPETMVFTEMQFRMFTNPNIETGGLSRAALKGLHYCRRHTSSCAFIEKTHQPSCSAD